MEIILHSQNGPRANALEMLLIDRSNEFREIAGAIGYSTKFDNWEEFILRFCLEFDDCFKMWWSERDNHSNHNKIHKCMTIMRQIGQGSNQYLAYYQVAKHGIQDCQGLCNI